MQMIPRGESWIQDPEAQTTTVGVPSPKNHRTVAGQTTTIATTRLAQIAAYFLVMHAATPDNLILITLVAPCSASEIQTEGRAL